MESEEELTGRLASSSTEPMSVTFSEVSFAYTPSHEVLHNMSFHVKPGQKVALVGESGGGKTTIFSLIERFYTPNTGTIYLDDTDIVGWSLSEMRSAIGYVEQDAPILEGTLRENLSYSVDTAHRGRIVECSRISTTEAPGVEFICGS